MSIPREIVITDDGYARTLSVLVLTVLLVVMFLLGLPARAGAEVELIPASFAEVAAKASPAVVNISTEKLISPGQAFNFKSPYGENDPFNQFWEKFFGGQIPQKERKEHSLGSGFIIDPTGLILTNNHVVEGAQDIVVKMSDEQEFHAEMLGRDPKTDLALIRIKSKTTLPFLVLGKSESVKIGDWVVAIGNPFGLDHTVTAGILSARGRVIGAGPYDDFLQTDASINPGNSGGPLLNLKGEVIGINTAISAQGQGIGFAIPTDLAEGIVAQLKEKGKVVRGWLGVMIQKITPELAASFDLKDQNGALVGDVTPGGPADEAGLKRGDVIIDFDGQKINDFSELPPVVAQTPVGKKVEVTVLRDGKPKVFNIKLGELKDEEVAAAPLKETEKLGLTVKEITPEMAGKMDMAEKEGLLITGVKEDSPAGESDLKAGDVIVEINREPVKTMGDFRKQMDRVQKGDTVLFLVKRGPNTLFFTVDAN